jgi:hypothetical protein
VTTPTPTGLYFPPWYQGGNPDAEILMQLLFQPMLGTTQIPDASGNLAWSPTYVVSWLPVPAVYDPWLNDGYAYLRAYRMGGPYNFDQNRDEPRVALAALTRSRDTSWYLMEFVRQVLNGYESGGTVEGAPGVTLTMAGEVVGPQQIPELIQDDRLVQITVGLHTKQAGIPNYKSLL